MKTVIITINGKQQDLDIAQVTSLSLHEIELRYSQSLQKKISHAAIKSLVDVEDCLYALKHESSMLHDEVHVYIDYIVQLSRQIREAEVLDGPRHLEKLEVRITNAFTQLFEACNLEYEATSVRRIVHTWIRYDVVDGTDFTYLKNNLLVDDGISGVVREFMENIAIIRQLIHGASLAVGRLASQHGLYSQASEAAA